jgi:hypothetical protein
MLWGRVMYSKYKSGMTFIEWVWMPIKNTQNGSICSKAPVEAFSLIRNNIIWNVSNGKKVRIEEDLWVGSGDGYKFWKAC